MPKKVTYLSPAQILAIHSLMIKRFGGSEGVRDLGLLESAAGRPAASFDGQDLYPTIFDKAAALLQSLLKNHPFIDGNKRTALASSAIFLQFNGWRLTNSHQEEIDFALAVDNGRLEVREISTWLKKHSVRMK